MQAFLKVVKPQMSEARLRDYFFAGSTLLPITPPTTAPPTVPAVLPPVSTAPATPPIAAPAAVFLSRVDMPLQAPSDKAMMAIPNDEIRRVFMVMSLALHEPGRLRGNVHA